MSSTANHVRISGNVRDLRGGSETDPEISASLRAASSWSVHFLRGTRHFFIVRTDRHNIQHLSQTDSSRAAPSSYLHSVNRRNSIHLTKLMNDLKLILSDCDHVF
jgi:hypothetical protein